MRARHIASRIGYSLIAYWGVVTIVFLVIRILPGDPAVAALGSDATPEQLDAFRVSLGLDRPLIEQYVGFLAGAAVFDFGTSTYYGTPAMGELLGRFPASALLAVLAVGFGVFGGFVLGIVSVWRPNGRVDRFLSAVTLAGRGAPDFWIALMLVLLFSSTLRLLPSSGFGGIEHLILPTATLAIPLACFFARLVRSGMLDVLNDPYITAADAKGVSKPSLLLKHAVPNMALPVVTMIGLQLGNLLGGAVIVEMIFAWPGSGRLGLEAIANRDYPMIEAFAALSAATFLIVNFLVDASYSWLDPRIRQTEAKR